MTDWSGTLEHYPDWWSCYLPMISFIWRMWTQCTFLDQTTPLFNHDSHLGCKLHALIYFSGTQIRIGFNGIIIVAARYCYSPVEDITSAWYNSSGTNQSAWHYDQNNIFHFSWKSCPIILVSPSTHNRVRVTLHWDDIQGALKGITQSRRWVKNLSSSSRLF